MKKILLAISVFAASCSGVKDREMVESEDIDIANEINRLIHTNASGEAIYPEKSMAYKEFVKMSNAARISNEMLDWKERGPANVAGRTRTILVDKSNSSNNTWLAGTAGGGIWKTINSGTSWFKVSPDFPNLSIVTLAQSESSPEIVYAGSGEGALGGNFINGIGIYKSTDSGDSWFLLESTTPEVSRDFQNVNRIIVHPDNANVLFAATSNGVNGQSFRSAIMKSIDGGENWEKIYSPTSRVQQILFDPVDPNIIYATMILQGVYKSVDGGISWTQTDLINVAGSFGVERTELAISPTDVSILYASVSYVNRSGSGLFMSEDAGDSWIQVNDPTDPINDFLEQGEYDNCIVVNPNDPYKVYWGGVNLWRGTIIPNNIISTDERDFLTVKETNVESFWDYVNFDNGTHFQNRLSIPDPSNTPSLEVRFGEGKSQKAHRFTVPQGSTSGVPIPSYSYEDYVNVPFEVWDIESNRQLMISFRDQEQNGLFNLNRRANDQDESNNREYLYIHDITYNANNPSEIIGVDGGIENQHYLFMWPTLPNDGFWDPENLPEASIQVLFGTRTFQAAVISQMEGDIHVDHHFLITHPLGNNFRLISVNDGGVGYSDDEGRTFVEVESRLNNTQFYNAVKAPRINRYIGGTQDNDVLLSSNVDPDERSSYEDTYGQLLADGFECAWNYFDANKIISSNQRNFLVRSLDGGTTWDRIAEDIDDTGLDNANAPFFTKVAYSINTDNLVFVVGASGIYRSSNFGTDWQKIELSSSDGWGGFLDVEVSDANPNIVWAGGGMSESTNLFVSTDAGLSFRKVNNFMSEGESLGNITTIVPDPNNENGVFVTFSQVKSPKVIKTSNLGITWEELSGFGQDSTSSNGFPDVGTYSLLAFPDGQTIWVGTEIGIVESKDAGSSWQLANNGIPSVLVWDLKVIDGQVIAATHGRGIWTVDLGLEYLNQKQIITSFLDEWDNKSLKFSIFPNPTSNGYVTITIDELVLGSAKALVIDLHGRVVCEYDQMKTGENKISVGQISGTYLIKMEVNDKDYFKKVTITN